MACQPLLNLYCLLGAVLSFPAHSGQCLLLWHVFPVAGIYMKALCKPCCVIKVLWHFSAPWNTIIRCTKGRNSTLVFHICSVMALGCLAKRHTLTGGKLEVLISALDSLCSFCFAVLSCRGSPIHWQLISISHTLDVSCIYLFFSFFPFFYFSLSNGMFFVFLSAFRQGTHGIQMTSIKKRRSPDDELLYLPVSFLHLCFCSV